MLAQINQPLKLSLYYLTDNEMAEPLWGPFHIRCSMFLYKASSLPWTTVDNELKYTKMLILSRSKGLHIANSPEIISTVRATEANTLSKAVSARLHTRITFRSSNTCSRIECNTGMKEDLRVIVC